MKFYVFISNKNGKFGKRHYLQRIRLCSLIDYNLEQDKIMNIWSVVRQLELLVLYIIFCLFSTEIPVSAT